MTGGIPKDTSILRCWIKESWSTSKKVGLWVSGIAVVLIAVYVAWLGLTSQTVAKFWAGVTDWCGSVIAGISNYVAAIPPLVFWGSIVVGTVVVAILGYSLVWCMARNLAEEDWKSDKANTFAAIAAFAIAAFAIAAIAAFAIAPIAAFAAFAIAAFAIAAFAIDPVDKITVWYYIFRFVGAYLNYKERTKVIPRQGGVEENKE
jgi:hypothetical protein